MSAEPDPTRDEEVAAGEVVDDRPGVALERSRSTAALQRPQAPPLPAMQAAAVAVTGFVAGAATAALVAGRRGALTKSRAPVRRRVQPGARPLRVGEIVSTSSFIVDVHFIRPRD